MSMKQLKFIKLETKLTVFGYVRQCETRLVLFSNVPTIVTYLCLSYFHHGEYFEKVPNVIQLSDEMTLTKLVAGNLYSNASYGKIWIESHIPQIARWKFKFKLSFEFSYIYICLVSHEKPVNVQPAMPGDKPSYALGLCNYCDIIANDESSKITQIKYQCIEWKAEDEISLVLDTKKAHIYFQRNDQEIFGIIHNITVMRDIKYKIAISIVEQSDSIRLTDFKLQYLV